MNHHTILFATDFSARDAAALNTASQLALRSCRRPLFLHVLDPRFEALSKASRKAPNVEFVRYIPKDDVVTFDQVVKVGEPHEEILKMADSENADMIILGTHGRSGLNRAFAGSVAEKVIRSSNTPVMTVRNSSKLNQHETPRILVPVAFSVYGYAALDYATQLALSIGAELTIVYVDDTDNSTTNEFPQARPEYSNQHETWNQLTKIVPKREKVGFSHKLLKGDAAAINDYA